MDDEVIRGATVCKEGEIDLAATCTETVAPHRRKSRSRRRRPRKRTASARCSARSSRWSSAALALLGLGAVAPQSFMDHFTVFVLACFVGYMVIWNVTPALHTPLMSVTNAISSIIIIGALLQISSPDGLIMWIAVATVLITAINIAGGFAVTRRMLEMFRK